ncbi:MAG: site-specific DNA-methyltransferase [Burkholderiales bacterium]|nr:site-specific DNA-methyltransferase [Burkholderiales bacterium]
MQNLYNDLKELLFQHERYTIEGKLNKPKIEDDGLNLDSGLIKLILQNAKLKKHFFHDVDGVMVFDKVKFQRFINNKQFLPDCYTEFKNKVGLTVNSKFLTESKEVVLDFPYKDCVLQGCQDHSDAKRDEVFFNETLAPDDIDMLLEPKVLTGFKKYDASGLGEVTDITMQDNLIIKGNNLLALHSLKRIYLNKVKLIYIDPPYNTGNDSFKYNDKFNHSTWLTFMKNRLEIARELLRDDGVIFIQCDDNEQAYLKVLLDQIFNVDNYICTIHMQVRHAEKTLSEDSSFQKVIEQCFIYSKNTLLFKPNRKAETYSIDKFEWQISECGLGKEFQIAGKTVKVFLPNEYTIKKILPDVNGLKETWAAGSLARQKGSSGEFFETHLSARKAIDGIGCLYKVYGIGEDGLGYRYFTGAKKEKTSKGKFYSGIPLNTLELFKQNKAFKYKPIVNFHDFSAEFGNCKHEGGVELNGGKKPEVLLQYIIDMATSEGDIILDYHLGSGTTAAVAHKMGRRYIGIEQMDYIDSLVITRLKNVIGANKDNAHQLIAEDSYQDYDTSGISKAVNWCGGGSFIYCELMQNNQIWVNKINYIEESKQLIQLWEFMQDKAQLSYKVNISKINANINKFECLSFEEQKRFLIEVLDKNQLYVNYTEIDDIAYLVSDKDRQLNHKFYSMK